MRFRHSKFLGRSVLREKLDHRSVFRKQALQLTPWSYSVWKSQTAKYAPSVGFYRAILKRKGESFNWENVEWVKVKLCLVLIWCNRFEAGIRTGRLWPAGWGPCSEWLTQYNRLCITLRKGSLLITLNLQIAKHSLVSGTNALLNSLSADWFVR